MCIPFGVAFASDPSFSLAWLVVLRTRGGYRDRVVVGGAPHPSWGCLGQRSDRELPAIPDEFDPSLLYSHISRQRPSGREASPPTVSKTDVFQLIPTCSFPPLLSIYIVVSFVYRVHALGME